MWFNSVFKGLNTQNLSWGFLDYDTVQLVGAYESFGSTVSIFRYVYLGTEAKGSFRTLINEPT